MFFKQYYLKCLAHASYLIADEESKKAVVVDPQRDVDQYVADAEEHGFHIEHVFLTHFHADFLAGHLEIARRFGATIHLGARAHADYAFEPARDGDELRLGQVRIQIMETPGHTPESISLVVYDDAASPKPYAVLTGDALFVGDVGRPDLMASIGITAEELAAELYDSLHNKLMKLPDATLVYPAHGAGSLCGKALGSETFTTIGEQRSSNYALKPMPKAEFITLVSEGQPITPKYFPIDAMQNRRDHEVLSDVLGKTRAVAAREVIADLAAGRVQVVDVRSSDAFANGHLAGSLNVGLEGSFATWAGAVLDFEKPIVVIASEGQEHAAMMRLGRIGLDHQIGYVEGGFAALASHPDALRSWDRDGVEALRAALTGESAPLVLDVRNPGEYDDGHIEGSQLMPLARLQDQMGSLPKDREIVVVCRSGYRSAVGASVLEGAGLRVRDLKGGMLAWSAANAPVVGASVTCTASAKGESSCQD